MNIKLYCLFATSRQSYSANVLSSKIVYGHPRIILRLEESTRPGLEK